MNNVGVLDIIAVYGSAFIILLLLIATFVFRIIRENKRKRKEQITVPAAPAQTAIPVTYPPDISGIPNRVLPSSGIDGDGTKQNSVIENIEMLSTLKRGIMWAEILGRPGGRKRRNT
jgi:hypothetical protein